VECEALKIGPSQGCPEAILDASDCEEPVFFALRPKLLENLNRFSIQRNHPRQTALASLYKQRPTLKVNVLPPESEELSTSATA